MQPDPRFFSRTVPLLMSFFPSFTEYKLCCCQLRASPHFAGRRLSHAVISQPNVLTVRLTSVSVRYVRRLLCVLTNRSSVNYLHGCAPLRTPLTDLVHRLSTIHLTACSNLETPPNSVRSFSLLTDLFLESILHASEPKHAKYSLDETRIRLRSFLGLFALPREIPSDDR